MTTLKNRADPRPLAPGVRVGDLTVRVRPFACPHCGGMLNANDVERIDDGLRAVCRCGTDVFEITDIGEDT
jgi:hypothetical protein